MRTAQLIFKENYNRISLVCLFSQCNNWITWRAKPNLVHTVSCVQQLHSCFAGSPWLPLLSTLLNPCLKIIGLGWANEQSLEVETPWTIWKTKIILEIKNLTPGLYARGLCSSTTYPFMNILIISDTCDACVGVALKTAFFKVHWIFSFFYSTTKVLHQVRFDHHVQWQEV